MEVDERFKGKWKKPKTPHRKLNEYLWAVLYPEGLKLADYVDIGVFTAIMARSGVEIRKNAQIGPHCAIYSESTIDGKKGKIVIEEGAKIGAFTMVMPGVRIGKGAIVGAHSFVNKDIPAGEMWAGVPAKRLRGAAKKT